MAQLPLEIKKHDFTKAMISLKKCNDRTAVAPKINRVEEKGFWFINHRVTGKELNKVTKSIQSHLINHKGLLASVFEELSVVYKVLVALDKEYIDAIIEASHWGSSDYLRKTFAILLLSNSISKPNHIWNET